jgi:hypothetical protein
VNTANAHTVPGAAPRARRAPQWPCTTAQLRRLLGITENVIRYVLRNGLLAEDIAPRREGSVYLWWPDSVLALAELLTRRGLGDFPGLAPALEDELRTWSERGGSR